MTEIFLSKKNMESLGLAKAAPVSSHPNSDAHTLLVCRRNNYKHENHYLTKKQVIEIFATTKHAYNAKNELNRFITIHLEKLEGVSAQKLLSIIMEKTRKWLQRNNFELSYVWVLENGNIKGLHAHILIHVPSHYISHYKRLLKKWLPFEITHDTLNAKRVSYPTWGQLSAQSRVYGLLRYMCKGITPSTPLYGIKPKYQGAIIGRRCGYSKLKNTREKQGALQ